MNKERREQIQPLHMEFPASSEPSTCRLGAAVPETPLTVPGPMGPGPSVERAPEAGSPSWLLWALQILLTDGSELCYWSPGTTAWVFWQQPSPPARLSSGLPFFSLGSLDCRELPQAWGEHQPRKVGCGLRVWAQPSFPFVLPFLLPFLQGLLGCWLLSIGRRKTSHTSSVAERGEEGFL